MRSLFRKIKARISAIPKLKNYNIYSEALKNKNGIEIGGPSSMFKDWRNLPVYKVLNNLNGCNFSNHTIGEGNLSSGCKKYRYHKSKQPGCQYIADAVDLNMIDHQSTILSYPATRLSISLIRLKQYPNGYAY